MKHLLIGAAVAASSLFASTTVSFAIGYQIDCPVGISGSLTVQVAAGGFETIAVSNAAGAKMSFSATLSGAGVTGGLSVSGGAIILDFPSRLTATVDTAMPVGTFLMLQATGGDASVHITCNPAAATLESLGYGNPSQSLQMARAAAADNIRSLVGKYMSSFTSMLLSSTGVGSDNEWDRFTSHVSMGLQYEYRMRLAAIVEKEARLRDGNLTDSSRAALAAEIERERAAFENFGVDFGQFQEIKDQYSHYLEQPGSGSAAIGAIDGALGQSGMVQNTFNVLGYGPTAGFEGNAVLSEGRGWMVTASANGAISQTSLDAGDINSMSGRGTINIITALTPKLGVGLGLSLGATSDDGPVLDDQAYHYAADLVFQYSVNHNLAVTGGLGYELTSNNYTQGAGAGSGFSHLYSAQLGLTGSVPLVEYVLAPSVDFELSHASAQSVLLTDGAVVDGYESTSGKITVGTQIGRSFVIRSDKGAVVIEPTVGLDTSLTLAQQVPVAGASSTHTGLGVGLTSGVSASFESGLSLSLSGRLSKSADTIGASLTGQASAGF